MRYFKRLLLTVLVALVGCLSASAHDFEAVNEGSIIYYKITSDDDLTCAVSYRGYGWTDYSNEYGGSVIIPSSVEYNGKTYSVTSIGDFAFESCSSLTSINIPNSVTEIGSYVFRNCSALTSINIPNSVTSIGDSAFEDCSSLTSANIPNSVTEIGEYAFEDCIALTSITIPNSVTSIGHFTFLCCRGLTSVNIPNSVTEIGNSAFTGCSSLTSINIPNSVTSIGRYAFSGCRGLTSVNIPNSVTKIGDSAFAGCLSLKAFTGKYSSEDQRSLIVNGNMIAYAPADLTSYTIPNSVTEIGENAFYGCSSLTSVTIPNSVTKIGFYAFEDCNSLTSITCYAEYPPKIYSFRSISSEAVLYVPVVALYLDSDWSKYFKEILPIESHSINVNLPADWQDGRYKDMTLELAEKGSEQRYKIVVSDKGEYSFSGLKKDTSYSLAMKNSWGDVLGEIENIEVGDEDVKVSFESLRQPKTVSLSVLANYGEDVTENVSVSWLKADGSLMKQGTSIAGVLEGSEICYQVTLPDAMLAEYSTPAKETYTVKADGNNISYTLAELGKVTFSGNILDANGRALPYAVLTISPLVNGKYGNSVTATTDAAGHYEAELPDLPLKVTVSANGYLSQTAELASAAEGLGQIVMEKISGLSISVTTDYADNANVAYRALDLSGNELEGCIYQGSSIVLPATVGVGDELTVVAYSKNNRFKDTSKTVAIDGKNTYVEIPIVEYGSICAKCEGDGYGCIAILYNNVGELAAKAQFAEGVATFSTVPDGQYSVVAMKKSSLLNSVLNLSSLGAMGLTAGRDYLVASATVMSGDVAEVSLGAIPELDEARLYLATGEGTYFMPGKAELTIGNYQVLKAKIDLKNEYAGKAKDAVLVVDIPSSCEFVENSVLSGQSSQAYQRDSNRVTIPMENIDDLVRFCVIPWEGGETRPTAFVQAAIDGNNVLLPIGTAYFEAKNFSLACVEKTARTTIALRGSALKDSEVLIYDNETLVGKTNALANGQWTANVTFAKPYSHSMHEIYGEVLTTDGKRLLTETKLVEYDKNYVDVEKVTMLYRSYKIEFDPINGKTSGSFYSYVPGQADFTFTANFTNDDPSLISNLTFKVLASDGTTRTLEGKFNETTNQWVASSKYADTHKLPVNVKVEYILNEVANEYDDEMENDYIESVELTMSSIMPLYENGDIEIITSNDREIILSVIPEGEIDKEYFKFEKLIYTDIKNELTDLTGKVKNDTIDLGYKVAVDNDELLLICLDYLNNEAFKITYSGLNPIRQNLSQKRILPAVIGILYGAGISVYERQLQQSLLDFWNNSYKADHNTWNKNLNILDELLHSKCKDGSYKIKDSNLLKECFDSANEWRTDAIKFFEEYQSLIKSLEYYFDQRLKSNLIINMGLSVIGSVVGNFVKVNLAAAAEQALPLSIDSGIEIITNSGGKLIGDIVTNPAFNGGSIIEAVSNWHYTESNRLTNSYIHVVNKIKSSYSECDKKEDEDNKDDEDKDYPTPPVSPSIDPSGYVYEAVPSNRLQGVTATVYFLQQTEDMYGDVTEEPVLWNAEEFGQQNPLITDEQGMYAWDVPQGMWQVKFDKEGYETTYSDWLPVPPPQLDVNIAMVQAKQPEVKNLHAYTDGITIEFDKYMLPETLTKENIKVSQNGKDVEGTVTLINKETDKKGNTYCSKIEFVPNAELAEGEATISVSKAVKSYASVMMGEDFQKTVKVESRIKDISVDGNVKVFSGSTVRIEGSVVPLSAGAGKKLVVEDMNPYIAAVDQNSVAIDANGNISFEVKGLIPGNAVVRLSLEGYDFHKDVTVNVLERNQVAYPVASLPSGSLVDKGTEIRLSCQTEGATIYYTTDGSCPCDLATAKTYDGTPIVINESVTIKAIAMKQDMEDSRIVEFAYIVKHNPNVPVTLEMTLDKGWNWISLNVNPTKGTDIAAVLGNDWTNGDYIKSNGEIKFNEFATGKGWKNTGDAALLKLGNEYMYHVKVANDNAIAVDGIPVNEATTSVGIHDGWNWISYLPQSAMELNAALANYPAKDGDIIKDISSHSTFTSGAWTGTLTQLQPGHGYMLYSHNPQPVEFCYGTAQESRATRASAQKQDVVSTSNNRYANNMTVVAKIVNVENFANTNLVASVNGEIRGTVANMQHPLTGENIYMLTVSGEGESAVDLALYGNDGKIGTAARAFTYKNDAQLGTVDNPLLIELQMSQSRVYPSPFTNALYVQYVPKDANADVSVVFASVGGQIIDNISNCNKNGTVNFSWDKVASVQQGVYIVSILENGNVCKTYKIIKK